MITIPHLRPSLIWGAVLVLIMAAVWMQRLNIAPVWLAASQPAQASIAPAPTNSDGYFYLAAARDLLNGSYSAVDPYRNAPFGVARRTPPPLLPRVMAWSTQLTGVSLEWIGVLLPALLAPLIAIPLYFIGRLIAGPWVGSGAALLGAIAPFYTLRTTLGWLDTDCLVVTLVFGITAALMWATQQQGTLRGVLLALGVLLTYVLFEWWDQAPGPVLLIGGFQLLLAVALILRDRKIALTLSMLVMFAALAALSTSGRVDHLGTQLVDTANYLFKQPGESHWPVIGALVSEQRQTPLTEVVRMSVGSPAVLVFSILGLILLLARAGSLALLLLLPVALGLLSFQATRFLVFLGPILALGTTYCAYSIAITKQGHLRRFRWAGAALYLFSLAVLILPTSGVSIASHVSPKRVNAIAQLRKTTPPDAAIWTDWDTGYPVQYWAQRPTFADGGMHGAERTVFLYLPLATNDFTLAARFMTFYAAHSMKGMHRVANLFPGEPGRGLNTLKQLYRPNASSDAIPSNPLSSSFSTEFLFPSLDSPVYLYLDLHTAAAFHSTYMAGKWNPAKQETQHANSKVFTGVAATGPKHLSSPTIAFDLEHGTFILNGTQINLAQARWRQGPETRTFSFPHKNGLFLEYLHDEQAAVVLPDYVRQTLFYQLFFLEHGGGRFAKVERYEFGASVWRLLPPEPPPPSPPPENALAPSLQ